jgi:hypothetical protein
MDNPNGNPRNDSPRRIDDSSLDDAGWVLSKEVETEKEKKGKKFAHSGTDPVNLSCNASAANADAEPASWNRIREALWKQ